MLSEIHEHYKQKYKLSKKYYNILINDEYVKNNNIDKTIISSYFLYYYDIMNPYPLFPTIISINTSKYSTINHYNINEIIDGINNGTTNMVDELGNIKVGNRLDYKNTSKYMNKLNKKIIKFTKLRGEKEGEESVRQFYSYEIKDEIKNKYNGEYVTVAWTKCYEIIHYYKFFDKVQGDTINYFGICEQPGAFIYAINHYIKQNLGKEFRFTLQSLNSKLAQGFKPEKNLSIKYRDVYDYGEDATGDVTNINNIRYYRKTYYKKHYNIITADCGEDCSKDFSKQEINLTKLVTAQMILAISLSDMGTNYFFKLFSIHESQTVHVIYILTYFFEEVNICRTLTTKQASGEIYCVCINFKHKKNEIDEIIENIYKWYEKYEKNETKLLLKDKIISDYFYEKMNIINISLIQRRLLTINFLYYRWNNNELIKKNKEIETRISSVVEHHKNYFMSIYNIQKLEEKNRLIPIKKQSRYIREITSQLYKQYIYPYTNIFDNDNYMKYIIGNNYLIKWKYIKSEHDIKYIKNDINEINEELIYLEHRYVINMPRIMHNIVNIYNKYCFIGEEIKIIRFVKKRIPTIKSLHMYNYSFKERHELYDQYNNYINDVSNKYMIEIINNYVYDMGIKIKYQKNNIYYIIITELLITLFNKKSIFNHIMELILEMIQHITNDSCIVLYINGFTDNIYHLINTYSYFFNKSYIFKCKYSYGLNYNVIFMDKKNINQDKKAKINEIKKVINGGNIIKIYKDIINDELKKNILEIHKEFIKRYTIILEIIQMKITNEDYYNLIQKNLIINSNVLSDMFYKRLKNYK